MLVRFNLKVVAVLHVIKTNFFLISTQKIEVQIVTIRTTDFSKISTIFKIIIHLITLIFCNNMVKKFSLTYNLIKTFFFYLFVQIKILFFNLLCYNSNALYDHNPNTLNKK